MRGNSIAVTGKIYPKDRDESKIDLAFSAGGSAYSNFNISCWSHKDRDDENVYINYRCVAFGDLAEHLADSAEAGDTVLAIGRIQANNWEDKEGNKRYDTQLIIDEIGLSLRWNTVSPNRVATSGGKKGKAAKAPKARDDYGPDEAPF